MTLCFNHLSQNEEVDLLTDRGFLLGDGVFETLRADDGVLLWFEDHFKRLTRHMQSIGLPVPWNSNDVYQFIQKQLTGDSLCRVRLSATAGHGGRGYVRPENICPRLFASVEKVEPIEWVDLLEVAPYRVPLNFPAKNLSGLDRIRIAPPVDLNWVYVSEAGFVTESTMANIFWVSDSKIKTPRLRDSLLDGLTRRRVIEVVRNLGIDVVEDDFPLESLSEASEIALTGTVLGIVLVKHFGEHKRSLGDHVMSPIRKAYVAKTQEEIEFAKKGKNSTNR